jgi:GDP-4-dehydro-6-deoxy-D-mannose reductase
LPFTENHPLHPNNPYGVSKATQESMAMQYRYSHGLDVVAVRPFNHIGPGQKPTYVVSSFASQIAEIEAGKREPVMGVGNMTAQRDFTDVRDTVRAYYQIVRLADAGRIYNVCSGIPRSIQSIFDQMIQMSKVKIEVRPDPAKFRVTDTPVSYGDNSLLRQEIGWQPEIPFEQTVTDILNHWRSKVAAGEPAAS